MIKPYPPKKTSFFHFLRLAKDVLAVAYYVVRDPFLAEDIMQDTFLTAMNKLHQLRDGERVGCWLKRIAVNKAYSELRKRKRLAFLDSPSVASNDIEETFLFAKEGLFLTLLLGQSLNVYYRNLAEKYPFFWAFQAFHFISLLYQTFMRPFAASRASTGKSKFEGRGCWQCAKQKCLDLLGTKDHKEGQRMMRKVAVLLTALLLVSCVFAWVANAAPGLSDRGKVVFEKAPITDVDVLHDRALRGISDLSPGAIRASSTLTDPSGETLDVPVLVTAEKIREVQYDDGSELTTYSVTSIGILAVGSVTIEEYDSSVSWRCVNKLYYDEYKDASGQDWGKLTKGSVAYYQLDSQVSGSNAKMTLYQKGQLSSGSYFNQSTDLTIGVPSLGTTYSKSVSWPYIKMWSCPGQYEVRSDIDLKRGSSTWHWQIKNTRGINWT